MILAVGVAAFVALVALGLLVPRFLERLARTVWDWRVERRRQRVDGGSVVGLVRSLDVHQARKAHGERPRILPVGKSGASPARDLADESGNALPSALAILTFAAFGYVAVVIVRALLRAAGALP